MAKTPFEKYEARRQDLIKKMQTLKEFEESDNNVKNIVDVARLILMKPNKMANVPWLLENGGNLAGYYGYLLTKGNEAWAEWKQSEIAFKEIRDALMLVHKQEKHTVTEAKANAAAETGLIETDVIVKEKRSRDYEACAKWCQAMLSFIQSTLRTLENERSHTGAAERGRRREQ